MAVNESYLRNTFENAPMGVAFFTLDGTILRANPAFQKMLGYSEDDLRGMSTHEFTHPEDIARDHKLVTKGTDIEHTLLQMERRYIRKDGAIIWGQVTGIIVDFEQQAVFAAIIKDITHQKASQAQQKFEEKMSSLERVASAVSHDFRNLLSLIDTQAKLIQMDQDSGTSHTRPLQNIFAAIERGSSLIDQITRLTSSNAAPCEPVKLDQFIEELAATLQQIAGKTVPLRYQLDPSTPVQLEPDRLQEILFNLVANARYAVRNGGFITIGVEERTLEDASPSKLGTITPGTYVVLTIRDTGEGMEPETISHIFEPFYTTHELSADSGRGLAQVSINVRRARGHITVESTPGVGIAFHVFFPLPPKKPAPQKTVPDTPISH